MLTCTDMHYFELSKANDEVYEGLREEANLNLRTGYISAPVERRRRTNMHYFELPKADYGVYEELREEGSFDLRTGDFSVPIERS